MIYTCWVLYLFVCVCVCVCVCTCAFVSSISQKDRRLVIT